jgi:hypothetical protein
VVGPIEGEVDRGEGRVVGQEIARRMRTFLRSPTWGAGV